MTNSISSLLWISIVIPDFKRHNAIIYFMKPVYGCKDVSIVFSRWTVKTDKFTLIVYCNFLVSLSVCSQNINKQIVNITDKNLTDNNFLSKYHYTKSMNYLKDDIEFVNEFLCLLGHPVYCHISAAQILTVFLDSGILTIVNYC